MSACVFMRDVRFVYDRARAGASQGCKRVHAGAYLHVCALHVCVL